MPVHQNKSNKKNTRAAFTTWHRKGQAYFIILIEYDMVYIITLDR